MSPSRSLAAICAFLVLTGCSASDWRAELEGAAPETSESEAPLETDLERDTTEPPHSDLATVIDEVLPAVVNVKVTASYSNVPVGRGEGSGVVIDPSGIVLTNYHVVACATEVRIVFTDEREPLVGEVIGAVPERDLAVVKVEAESLPTVPIGSSERMRLGDDVVAIGFPLGLGGPTVTRGIVSGEDRRIEASGEFGRVERLEGLLQTDAAINPGNSGGPLIDSRGRLVGINTAVAGGAENIGFAIAIDEAFPVVEEILAAPVDRSAWLGVSLADPSATTAVESELPSDAAELWGELEGSGAGIAFVVPQSPAEDAELPLGGVVTSVEGQEVSSAEEMIELLRGFDPGDEIELTVATPTGTRRLTVTAAQRPFNYEELC